MLRSQLEMFGCIQWQTTPSSVTQSWWSTLCRRLVKRKCRCGCVANPTKFSIYLAHLLPDKAPACLQETKRSHQFHLIVIIITRQTHTHTHRERERVQFVHLAKRLQQLWARAQRQQLDNCISSCTWRFGLSSCSEVSKTFAASCGLCEMCIGPSPCQKCTLSDELRAAPSTQARKTVRQMRSGSNSSSKNGRKKCEHELITS